MLPLLTDPFLQLPTESTVSVVWFTEWEGDRHWVEYGENLDQQVAAGSQKITLREDGRSYWPDAPVLEPGEAVKIIDRPVWRHEAVVVGLKSGDRIPYRVVSEPKSSEGVGNQPTQSRIFHLSPLPGSQRNLKILLTSDHQMMAMVPQSMQHAEALGPFDAVFYAGDVVNVPDRASEWFDDRRGRSFFPCFQGRAITAGSAENQTAIDFDPRIDRMIPSQANTQYAGGEILQNTPIFPCIGNHEVMGNRFNKGGLSEQFSDPVPVEIATGSTHDQPWIDRELRQVQDNLKRVGDRPFNTDAYESIFTLPKDSPGGKRYYAVTFGSIRLISLEITNVWRWYRMDDDVRGRYRERAEDFDNPQRWGGGQIIFESIEKGSVQYQWLLEQLEHPDFKSAKYRIVMFHHPPHSLGRNIVPPYVNPLQQIQRDADGSIVSIRYQYERSKDFLMTNVVPLLEKAGVHLAYYGHCHIWNRFEQETEGGTLHFLESSHAGSPHGVAWGDRSRSIPDDLKDDPNYIAVGNPNGLPPITPTIAPLLNPETQEPLPYIAHDGVGVFSVLDTGTGEVSSYRFESGRSPIKFDIFKIG
ncbi:MAG: metallophosphoesterase [Cyanobacteria bacterium P01_D01_bin.73]